ARRLLDRKPELLHRLYGKTRLLSDVFNLGGILPGPTGSERNHAGKRAIRHSRFLSYSSHALKRLIERHGPLLEILHPLLRSLEALGKTRSPCAEIDLQSCNACCHPYGLLSNIRGERPCALGPWLLKCGEKIPPASRTRFE